MCRFVLFLFCLILPLFAGDQPDQWPQFLGPDRNGEARATGVFSGPINLKIAWKRELGSGYSGVVSDGKALYTMHKSGAVDVMVRIDPKSGKEVWRYEIGPFFPKIGGSYEGPVSTPTVKDGVVYGLGARGHLFALNTTDGKPLWKTHLADDLGGVQPRFGFTTSPLIVGDHLIVQIGNPEGKSIGAFDKSNGSLVWSVGKEEVNYQSPTLCAINGRKQVFALTKTTMSGYDPKSGSQLWSHPNDNGTFMIQTGKDRFLSDHGKGFRHCQVRTEGDKVVVDSLWQNDYLELGFDIPVYSNDRVYGFKKEYLVCLDGKTGERIWKERMPGKGLTMLLDGRLIVWTHGELRIADITKSSYQETAALKVLGIERGSYTFPSYANGHLYVRNLSEIAAISIN